MTQGQPGMSVGGNKQQAQPLQEDRLENLHFLAFVAETQENTFVGNTSNKWIFGIMRHHIAMTTRFPRRGVYIIQKEHWGPDRKRPHKLIA
jgi:hypothetical protein